MKIIYATDLDRTLIYSKRFIDETNSDVRRTLVESKAGKGISYMSDKVIKRLRKFSENNDVIICPVTTRSVEEFSRIKLPFNYKYAIVSNGGILLEDGKVKREYNDTISPDIDLGEMLSISMDLADFKSVKRDSKIIDGKYIFNKTDNEALYDLEADSIAGAHPKFNFVRQKNKVYVIPKAFSKGVALRWLQHYTKSDKILAMGDSQLDLTMLAIADYAIVPEHGALVKEGYVTGGRLAEAGLNSPLYAIDTIEQLLAHEEA